MADQNVEAKQLDEEVDALDEDLDVTPAAEAEEEAPQSKEDIPEVRKAQFEKFEGDKPPVSPERKMSLLLDVQLPVTIELGRTQMYIKKILELERGSIIELDKMAGEPVDLFINNKKMAEGEVVVVDKHFGIRITNLIDPADRIKNLGNH